MLGLLIGLLAFASFALAQTELRAKPGPDWVKTIATFESTLQLYSKTEPTDALIKSQIDDLIPYLIGSLSHPIQQAILGDKAEIWVGEAKHVASNDTWLITYIYKNDIHVKSMPASKKLEGRVPVNPYLIYESSLQSANRRGLNPCTHELYQSEADFWFFWEPSKPGCQLREGSDFIKVEIQLK